MAKEAGHVAGRPFTGQDGVWVANQSDLQVLAGDGAIALWQGNVILTKGTAAAITLAAPVAGDDDSRYLAIISTTAAAHVVTFPSNVLNGNKITATFGAAANNCIELVAHNAVWRVIGNTNVTLA